METKSERVYYMDLARATILMTGVFFHAALLYEDKDGSLGLHWFPASLAWFLDSTRHFRMEALFLVSGFFSAVLVDRRGVKGFFRNRTVRMGVPLLVCGVVFNPIPYLFLKPLWIPWSEPFFFINGVWKNHLWNIANLLAYEASLFSCLMFLPAIHKWLGRIRIPLVLCLAGYLATWFAFSFAWGHLPSFRFPDFFVTARYLPLYAPAYLLGYLIQRNKGLRDWLFDLRASLPLALFTTLAATGNWLPDRVSVVTPAIVVLQRISLACVLFSVVRILETPNVWIRRISIASYTIYLLHLPLQAVLIETIPALRQGWLAYVAVGIVPIGLLWLFHIHVVERWGWAGFMFNGKVYDAKTRSF